MSSPAGHPLGEGIAAAPARVLAAELGWAGAWERVKTKAGMPGADGVSVSRFGRAVPGVLRALEGQLAAGDYRPVPLRLATMAKKTGGTRVLLVPAVRDRVAQTAVAAWLGCRWNPQFDAASFAYRPGLGVHAALRSLRQLYERGGRWVLDADIRRCFDSIDHARLFDRLAANLGASSPVVGWLRQWMAAIIWDGQALRLVRAGVPQGSPLSPLLANFYLDDFDRRLRAAKVPFVRYADDFLIVGRTPFDVAAHRRIVEAALSDLGLSLNAEKTRITSFERWFRFVGAEIQGPAILLPFEKLKQKLQMGYVAPPMSPTLMRAWRGGHLRPAGDFDPTAAVEPAPGAPDRALRDARAGAPPANADEAPILGSGARPAVLDRLRRRP